MDYLAHSKREGTSSQGYADHIHNVNRMAIQNAEAAGKYSQKGRDLLVHCANISSTLHDLGKLNLENQKALHQESKCSALPVNHVDAGAAVLKTIEGDLSLSSLAVFSHHRGLPNLPSEYNRGQNCFRDDDFEARKTTSAELNNLLECHERLLGHISKTGQELPCQGDKSVFVRILLSCLTDADHTDTARHYGKYPHKQENVPLRADERLEQLNAKIEKMNKFGERNRLRSEMYRDCRDCSVSENITACDSPVGSGKTTAIMAHLLNQAIQRKARRVFVILPFTNIISQSVQTYRDALVLPGEDPEAVVAELHHRADFTDEDTRALNAQWRAPIIVTTAVAFFETLASNLPAALRRLHELPGSVIFVDEAHAALPVKLLPLAWKWMQVLADEWSCYWVLASGSLVRFWELEELTDTRRNVPQIVSENLRGKLSAFEQRRIRFPWIREALSRKDLIKRVREEPGPRLLIMNTVQSAAVMARDLKEAYELGKSTPLAQSRVLHLSTALSAEDRETIIDLVKQRFNNEDGKGWSKEDRDWVLVATSCVEAGIDFSFCTGFREISSLLSLLQASGRVSRGGEYPEAAIWSFIMQDDPMLTKNPGIEDSAFILEHRFFKRGIEISPDKSTKSVQIELNRVLPSFQKLLSWEEAGCFKNVNEEFRVIESDTVLVIADDALKRKLRFGEYDWREIQRKGISIHRQRAKTLRLPILAEGLYDWNLKYDSFLGVMAGTLDYLKAKDGFLIC